MKKNKLKYVLIPAFTTAAMFPIFADNNAKASDENTTVAATQPAAQPNTQPTFQKEPKEISNKIPMTVSE